MRERLLILVDVGAAKLVHVKDRGKDYANYEFYVVTEDDPAKVRKLHQAAKCAEPVRPMKVGLWRTTDERIFGCHYCGEVADVAAALKKIK